MNAFNWHAFLQQWSNTVLSSDDLSKYLPQEVVDAGYLGYPGATEEQIRQAEARLGISLPHSYRSFLRASNGWRSSGSFMKELSSIGSIEWFSVRHQPWIDAYTFGLKEASQPSVEDDEYFVYGEDQIEGLFRPEYLKTALEISEEYDGAIFLLNPQVITPDGEWEAWFFANWLPGANRYRSFQEMMQAEYEDIILNRSIP